MDEQIKPNRKEIKAEEAARRAQRYLIPEVTEHQRHLMMAMLRRLRGYERTKPERELLKILKELQPTKETRATKKKIKEQAKKNGKVDKNTTKRLPASKVQKPAPKPGKLGKGRVYD